MCCTNTAEAEDRDIVDFMLATRRYFDCGPYDAAALQRKLEAAHKQVDKAFERQVELLCSTEYKKDSGSESCSCAKQEQLPQQDTSQKVKYHIVILA